MAEMAAVCMDEQKAIVAVMNTTVTGQQLYWPFEVTI